MGHEHDHGCKHCHEHEHGHEHKHGQGENGFAVPLVRLVLVVILTAAAWIAPLENLP